MWYNIASANSNASLGPVVSEPEDWRLSTDLSGFAERNAGLMRDNIERIMTRAQIERATESARACMASNYGECGP